MNREGQAERRDRPPRYGLAQPLHSYNPLRIALHGWIELFTALQHSRSLRDVVRTLFGPPSAILPPNLNLTRPQ